MSVRRRADGNGRAHRGSTLSELQRAQAAKLLAPLCEVPEHARDQLRIDFRFDGPSIILFESRPRFLAPQEWGIEDIAKFRYLKQRDVWRLFCQFRDLRWRAYDPLPEARMLARLVEEVRTDPTGIFWG